ncbi:MAG: hypothetical protein ACFFCE_10560 [Promethearchaeota archaeon]
MNLMVLGGAGSVDVQIIPPLLDKGQKLTCLDTLWFGDEYIEPFKDQIELITTDIINCSPDVFKGIYL